MDSFSKAEIRQILVVARARRERDFLMILVGYLHGLRASEVIALTPDNLKDDCLVVQRLKGSAKTIQPLLEDQDPLFNERAALVEFTRNMHRNQRLFPVTRVTFWRNFRRYVLAAGLGELRAHPHTLKHSIALETINSAGVHNVRQYLGHKSLSSTGAYLKVTDAEASEAVARGLRG